MLYLVYKILSPFLTAIVASMVLAYILHPVYRRVNRYIGNRNAAAIITAVIVIIIITIPLLFFLNALVSEANVIFIQTKQVLGDSNVFGEGCLPDATDVPCIISNYANNVLSNPQVKFYLRDFVAKATNFVLEQGSSFIFSLPKILMSIFVTIFTLFYLFKEGKGISNKIAQLMPFRLHHQKEVIRQVDEITYAVIYGAILIAIVQGTLGGIIFWIFGINSPVFWGLVMILFSFVPFVGASVIWFPAALITFAAGRPGAGLGIFLGGVFISWVDNIIRPKIVGKKAGIHPVLVLIGVLGGLATFGLVGGILGPLILALFITFLKIYHRERVQGY